MSWDSLTPPEGYYLSQDWTAESRVLDCPKPEDIAFARLAPSKPNKPLPRLLFQSYLQQVNQPHALVYSQI